jgi:hypothetical protein
MVSGMRDRKEKEQGTVQAAGRPAARVRGAGKEGGRAAWLSATVAFHPLSVGGCLGPPPSAGWVGGNVLRSTADCRYQCERGVRRMPARANTAVSCWQVITQPAHGTNE